MTNPIQDKINSYLKLLAILTSDKDDFGRSQNFIEVVTPAIKLMYEKYFRVDLFGVDSSKGKGPFIFVSNHSGTIPYDAAMIAYALLKKSKKNVNFLADNFAYKLPIVGDVLRLLGAVPAKWDNAINLLESGNSILIFPEFLFPSINC